MTRVWRLIDRHLCCLHCWDMHRAVCHAPIRESWRAARACLEENR